MTFPELLEQTAIWPWLGVAALLGLLIGALIAVLVARSRSERQALEIARLEQQIRDDTALQREREERSGAAPGPRFTYVDVTGRVAHAIMDLCNEPDAMTHPDGMQIKVSRQELSRLVGCSREMAGRVLKVLEEQGLVSASGKTIVVYGARPKRTI